MKTPNTSVTPTQTADKDLGTCRSTATVEAKVSQQTGHTPGPWQNCRDGVWSSDGFDCIIESRHISGKSIEQSWANARLIAAAPTMLEALKDARWLFNELTTLGWFDKIAMDIHPDKINTPIDNVLDAIAKAEGK